MNSMETAPRDKSILLLIDENWIEGYWDESFDRWSVVTLPSHGCGCCSYPDPEPTGWARLPSTKLTKKSITRKKKK